VRGLKLLMKHRVPATVRVTIHRKNVRELDGVARFLLEEIDIPNFGTNSASYMGLCRQNADDVQLTTEDRVLAMETLLRLNQKYNGRINATAGPLAEARGWLEMERARKEGKERIPGRGFLTGCGGPMSKMAVRADGIMVPCIQLSHIELGRINKDSLEEVWQNHPELKKMRERCHIPLSKFEYCQDCPYINYCTGNCPATSYTITGEVDFPSPDACLKRFLEEGGRLPDMNLFADTEKNG